AFGSQSGRRGESQRRTSKARGARTKSRSGTSCPLPRRRTNQRMLQEAVQLRSFSCKSCGADLLKLNKKVSENSSRGASSPSRVETAVQCPPQLPATCINGGLIISFQK